MAKKFHGNSPKSMPATLPSGYKVTTNNKIGGSFNETYDDTVSGIDKQINADVASLRKNSKK